MLQTQIEQITYDGSSLRQIEISRQHTLMMSDDKFDLMMEN